MFKRCCFLFLLFLFCIEFNFAQTNSKHVKISGYTRNDGTYVQPYFRTVPNSTNRDNFSTKENVNPYTGKPGWIFPDSKYNTFYYATFSYSTTTNKIDNDTNLTVQILYKNRTYIVDEHGVYSCYLTIKDERTFNIYDMKDNLILYLVINHRGDWRIFDNNWIYIKTIFVTTEK